MNRREIQKQKKTKPASRGKDDQLFGLTLDVSGTWIFLFIILLVDSHGEIPLRIKADHVDVLWVS